MNGFQIFVLIIGALIGRGLPKIYAAYRRGDELEYDWFGRTGAYTGEAARRGWLIVLALNAAMTVFFIVLAFTYTPS